jgi:uncharacterized membrane-anchored protein
MGDGQMLTFRARFGLLVAWQILLLLVLLAPRWVTASTGTTIVLNTVPVDPRDFFRGEYVALRYDVSRLDPGVLVNRVEKGPLQRRDSVYVVLKPSGWRAQEPWQAVAVFDRRPTEDELASFDRKAALLRGQVTARSDQAIELEYGIESYFVPEGQGRRLEGVAGKGLTAEIKVDARGRAVLRRLLVHGAPLN